MEELLDSGLEDPAWGADLLGADSPPPDAAALEQLQAALATIEGESLNGPLSGETDDFAGLDAILDDLMMVPPTVRPSMTIEDLLVLLENYPGLKVTISF